MTKSDHTRQERSTEPEIRDDGRTITLPDTPEGKALGRRLVQYIRAVRTENQIAEVLTAASAVPSQRVLGSLAAREQAIRHLEYEYGLLTSSQVPHNAGSRSSNPSEFASRLARAWDAIAVRRGRSLLFPGFQFEPSTGRTAPDLSEVFKQFRAADWDQESVALWFVSPSAKLGAREPADVLRQDRSAVLSAALDAAAVW